MNARSKACDISPVVKRRVWERDEHCCVYCGSSDAMPNAHYISRHNGGLGIEQNIVTLCRKCHYIYDNGTRIDRERYKKTIREYLMHKYTEWHENKLIYRKWEEQ